MCNESKVYEGRMYISTRAGTINRCVDASSVKKSVDTKIQTTRRNDSLKKIGGGATCQMAWETWEFHTTVTDEMSRPTRSKLKLSKVWEHLDEIDEWKQIRPCVRYPVILRGAYHLSTAAVRAPLKRLYLLNDG